MAPQDKGDIESMDEKEEESKEGKRNTGSLDAQDDDGDARPTGRLDPATLDGRTVPELKEMCRQVSNYCHIRIRCLIHEEVTVPRCSGSAASSEAVSRGATSRK